MACAAPRTKHTRSKEGFWKRSKMLSLARAEILVGMSPKSNVDGRGIKSVQVMMILVPKILKFRRFVGY